MDQLPLFYFDTNLDCDRKFRDFRRSGKALRRLSDTICVENGYSIIENPKQRGKAYNKWLGDHARPRNRDVLRAMIDEALAQKPSSFDEILSMLRSAGCEVKRGKQISLRGLEQKRFCRLDTLGDGYDEAVLRAILSGERSHQLSRKTPAVPATKIDLLVDIQAKQAKVPAMNAGRRCST